MNRRLTALLVAGLASGGFAVAAPSANAAGACVVVAGNAHLSKPIFAGTFTSDVGFTITASCANGGTISANGTLFSASCGLSNGEGQLSDGTTFSLQTAGTVLVITGGANGTGNAVADVRTGDSCSPLGAGADDFIVTGVINS